jgi:hypothetical protein
MIISKLQLITQMLQLKSRFHISRENRKYLVMLWQRTHSPAKDPSNRFVTKLQHNFETAPLQTKFRCQQSRGWSQSEEASANPVKGRTRKMNREKQGKEGQNLKGKMAKGVFTNTSSNIVSNTAHHIVLVHCKCRWQSAYHKFGFPSSSLCSCSISQVCSDIGMCLLCVILPLYLP